ncbi:hypothetical protein ACWFR1_21820 [Streptomyces sp. NPDC055103]
MPTFESAASTTSRPPRWLRIGQGLTGALTGLSGVVSLGALLGGFDVPADTWVSLFGASGALWIGLLALGRRALR